MPSGGSVERRGTGAGEGDRCAAPPLSASATAAPIHRDGPLLAALRAVIIGTWMTLRVLLIPLLYIPYKLGIPTCWAYRIDAFVKRTCLPMTELPDDRVSRDVTPAIRMGEVIPDGSVKQRGQSVSIRDVAKGHALLLVAYRGSWCSYSRLHLADLAKSVNEFQKSGVEMLAVSARRDERWWRSRGIDVPLAADPQGRLFDALGVKAPQGLQQKVWGTMVPHESVFLFDAQKRLVACDIRSISNVRMKQRFLSAKNWLDLCRQQGLS